MAELVPETPRATSIALELPCWPGHLPGQYVDVRLTADDGHRAQRSYSIASAPEDGFVVLTVERVPGGDVSRYLAGDLRTGDQLELRGPMGGYFVWDDSVREPVLLVAEGPGIVPFRSMLRHRQAGRAQLRGGSEVAVTALELAASLSDQPQRGQRLVQAAYLALELGRWETSVRLARQAQQLPLAAYERTSGRLPAGDIGRQLVGTGQHPELSPGRRRPGRRRG